MQAIFSSGKQIETIIMALLVDKGLVQYEEKVSTYWPEFAQGGKDEITVADVMRHSGGVPWFLNPETCEPGQVKVSAMPYELHLFCGQYLRPIFRSCRTHIIGSRRTSGSRKTSLLLTTRRCRMRLRWMR